MIVIDLEMTGTDPDEHAIVSIGALEFENPDNDFYTECSIWDGAKIEEKALEINGFEREDITDPHKQPLEVALIGLSRWIETCQDQTIAGHNVHGDLAFLKSSYERCGLSYPFPHRTIDTHSIAYCHIVLNGNKLPYDNKHHRTDITSDFLFTYVGLDAHRSTHNALEDARLTAEALSRLLYSRPLLKEYKESAIPWI